MIDQPAPFDSPETTAARVAAARASRGQEATPVVDVSALGRPRIGRFPMTPRAAAAAFLTVALVAELTREP